MKQPPDPDAHPLAAPRPSEYVIVPWASEQLRDRIQRNNAALAQRTPRPRQAAPWPQSRAGCRTRGRAMTITPTPHIRTARRSSRTDGGVERARTGRYKAGAG